MTTPTKKVPAKKAATKPPAKKVPAKKAPLKKAPAKKSPPIKKAPAKKAAPVKKVPAKKTVAKKAPSKKVAAKKVAAKKAPAKKTPAKKGAVPMNYETDVHGIRAGSDISLIANELIKGGKDRSDIVGKIRGKVKAPTRGDNPKNIPSLVSLTISMLTKRGYKIESHYRIVPPAKIQKKMEEAKTK